MLKYFHENNHFGAQGVIDAIGVGDRLAGKKMNMTLRDR
jgi:hypothetical protein